jgi:hypothetical protein
MTILGHLTPLHFKNRNENMMKSWWLWLANKNALEKIETHTRASRFVHVLNHVKF